MANPEESIRNKWAADCERCFGLCCVALPFAKSVDFAFGKESGTPCRHLQADYRCGIHGRLRASGLRGCTVYDCFGAGQHVSQRTYRGKDWRSHPEIAREMFDVLPVMRQLHEMLCYLHEAIRLEAARPLREELRVAAAETERLTELEPGALLTLDVPAHRARVSALLLRTSRLARAEVPDGRSRAFGSKDLAGASFKGADLRGADLRGALLIAADLRGADLRLADLLGADLRDADLRGADLRGCLFLTQSQANAARGGPSTKLSDSLNAPEHWLKRDGA